MITPSCLWSVGCQIVSVLTFLTGVSANLKRGHVKRYAVALSVFGGLAVTTLPGASLSFNPAMGRWRFCLNYYRRLLQAECGKSIEMDRTTVTLQRLATLSQPRELHWTDKVFRQWTITGSSKGQRINWEVMSQPVLVVQKVVRIFFKSFTWTRKCLLQTEANVARKNLLVVLWHFTLWMSERTLPCPFGRWRVKPQCLRILPRLDQSRN